MQQNVARGITAIVQRVVRNVVRDTITPKTPAMTALRRQPPRRATVFLLFATAYLLSYFYRTANAVIAGDLARDLALDAARLGLMTSLFFATFALAQLPLGLALDRWGPRITVPILMAVAVTGSLIFAAARTFAPLALGRALIGVGMAAILPSAFKVFSLWYPPHRVATMSGLLVGFGSSGALIAATPLAWLAGAVGWRSVFVAAAIATAGSALAIAGWARDTPPGVTWPKGETGGSGFGAVFADRRFWRIAPQTFFFTGGLLSFQGLWAGPYLFDVPRLAPVAAGNILLLLALGATVGYGLSGWLADRLGVARVIVASGSLFALCQGILALRPSLAIIAPVYLLFGLSGGFCIMSMAHARHLFPPAITARAVAAVNLFGIGGSFCLQWWIGLIVKQFASDATGHYPPQAYTTALLCVTAGTVLTLLWYLPLARATWREPQHTVPVLPQR